MKGIVRILLIAFIIVWTSGRLIVTKEMTNFLKKKVIWEVANYEDNIFKSWTEEEFINFIGKNFPGEMLPRNETYSALRELPENFDSRKRWPKCIHPIRQQGKCGSCWAHGTSEALSDRFCISGIDANLSPQDLVSCDKKEMGCGGGYMVGAYKYMEEMGAVSEECLPYVSAEGYVPPCPPQQCPSGKEWKKYKCKQDSVATITEDIEKMKAEIYTNGPVTTWQDYCEDFAFYKSGVYYHQVGRCYTGHIMKVIGWGVESNLNYWLIANSFGLAWGEKGYVKFKMRDCGIDKWMAFCSPQI